MTKKQTIASLIGGAAIAVAGSVALLANKPENTSSRIYITSGSHMDIVSSDTFVVSSGTYYYFGNCQGVDSAHPLVIINEGAVTLSNGFAFENCKFIKLLGNHIKIQDNVSGVAVGIKGKSDHIEISGLDIDNCTYAIWCKNEVQSDYLCDSSYWYPLRFLYMKFHDITATNIHQDGFYLGSTDPYNTGRPVTCGGKVIHPRPTGLGFIEVYNCYLRHIQRTGIQLSNCDTGNNSIHDNYVGDCGDEYNNSQGGGIIAGGATANISIYNNTISKTWDHAIWGYPVKLCKIYNNTIDSSGFAGTRMQVYDVSPIFLNNFSNPIRTTFKIYNNTAGISTDKNHYEVAVFNNGNSWNIDNCIMNSGKVYTQSGVIYSTTCSDTVYIPPPTDTSITNVEIIFYRADGSTFRPLNWLKLLDRDSVYFVKYKDGKGRNYKKQTFGLFSK